MNQSIPKNVAKDYDELALYDKLYVQRSSLPAILYVDFSARIQTVSKQTNRHYWELLNAFKQLTGSSVLINTSFNVRGEPVVCTPEDAYRCFIITEMDILVIENFIFIKEEQPTSISFKQKTFDLD